MCSKYENLKLFLFILKAVLEIENFSKSECIHFFFKYAYSMICLYVNKFFTTQNDTIFCLHCPFWGLFESEFPPWFYLINVGYWLKCSAHIQNSVILKIPLNFGIQLQTMFFIVLGSVFFNHFIYFFVIWA